MERAVVEIHVVQASDLDLLMQVEEGLFDSPVDPGQARAFLDSPLHHMVVAFANGQAVSFASGSVLLHPDKAPSMFINEVGTRAEHRRRGYGAAVLCALIDHGRGIGCKGIWLGTEPENAPALALYRSLGGAERPIAGFAWDNAFGPD